MRAGCDSHRRMSASPRLRERPDKVIAACRLLGFEQLFMPAVPPEQRDMDAPRLARAGARTRCARKALCRWRDSSRLSQPQLGAEAKRRREDRARTAVRGGGRQPLAWQADVAWLVRGGAAPEDLAAALPRPPDLRPREGHRTGRHQAGRGRLGRCRRRRAGLARAVADLSRLRRTAGWSWSTTSRPTRHAPRARASPGSSRLQG